MKLILMTAIKCPLTVASVQESESRPAVSTIVLADALHIHNLLVYVVDLSQIVDAAFGLQGLSDEPRFAFLLHILHLHLLL